MGDSYGDSHDRGRLAVVRNYEHAAGLFLDEAADGAYAVQALETGDFEVFYLEDNGREGLYANIAAVFIHFFGSSAWALRLPAAVLTVAVIGLACALMGETAHTYFYLWAKDPRLPQGFDATNAVAADQINSLPKDPLKVVVIDGPSAAAGPFSCH